MARVPSAPLVVAYHAVHPAQEGIDAPDVITPPEALEHDVQRLLAAGYELLTAGELLAAEAEGTPPRRAAVLTFDDGWRDGLTIAAPLLRSLGVRATFLVCPGLFGNHDPRMGEAGHVMTAEDACSLHEAGMEIGAHSMTHPDMREIEDHALAVELEDSRDAVEAITGAPCAVMAYPFGLSDGRVRSAARRAGFRLAFSFAPGPWRWMAAPRVPAGTLDAAMARS
jgi:peptidoglycan/xylan/chitin deacetylase (PgdA/CDA1 family)